MATETAKNGRCTMQWEGHSFFCLGLAKATMVMMATMAATTTMTTMARTMAMMANYGSNSFSLPCSCTVKILENAVKLLEEHYLRTILAAYSNICAMEPVSFLAYLDRSHWAEKECHLSLLERTKIDQAKNHKISTSFT
jgi:hypothetical protein